MKNGDTRAVRWVCVRCVCVREREREKNAVQDGHKRQESRQLQRGKERKRDRDTE